MTDSEKIIREIKHLIGTGEYSFWSIGITTDPKVTREKLGHPPCWQMWNSGTLSKAHAIVEYFAKTYPAQPSSRIRKSPGERLDDTKMPYVYIY
jgi:hypothetical protein